MRSLRTCLACLLAASLVSLVYSAELPPDWWLITDEDPFFALQQELGDTIPDALKGGPVAAGAAASSGGTSATARPGGATASSGGSSASAGIPSAGATASAGSASASASAGSSTSSAAAEAAKAPLPAPTRPPRFPERFPPQQEVGGFGGGPGVGESAAPSFKPGGAVGRPGEQGPPPRPPTRQPGGGGPIIFPDDEPTRKPAGAETFSENTVFGGLCSCAHPTSCSGQPDAPQGECPRGMVCCPPELRYRPKCGRMTLQPRSAQAVRDSEAPWMAALLEKVPNGYIFVCGGTLIKDQVVLTAARCVQRFETQKDSLVVRLGETDILSNLEMFPPVEIAVKDIAIHANYSRVNKYNDLALLFLRDPAPLRPGLDTICVRRQTTELADCSIHSYGLRQTDSTAFDLRLREADQVLLPFRDCQRVLRGTQMGAFFNLHPSFRCTTSDVTCDLGEDRAGSPLTCPDPGRREHQLAGVVAWGIGCQRQQKPGVYTGVEEFYDWIDGQVTGYFRYIESAFGPFNQD